MWERPRREKKISLKNDSYVLLAYKETVLGEDGDKWIKAIREKKKRKRVVDWKWNMRTEEKAVSVKRLIGKCVFHDEDKS